MDENEDIVFHDDFEGVNKQNGPNVLSNLNIEMVDQSDLEHKVATDAEKVMLSKDLEVEEKRLSKANDKYLRFQNKLSILRNKLQNPNCKISDKTRISVQIEELEENEIMTSLQELQDIKARIKNIKLKMRSTTNKPVSIQSNEPQQMVDETREEYLIRTGKITAFGTSSAFIEEGNPTNDIKVPTHKDLVMPGFDNVESIDSASDTGSIEVHDTKDLKRRYSEEFGEEEADEDFKIDYDEINSDEIADDSEDIDIGADIDVGDSDDNLSTISSSRPKTRRYKAQSKTDNVDDGDDSVFKKRLDRWVLQRSTLRKNKFPDYQDDPTVPEWRKPHPTIKDSILNDQFKLPGDVFPSLFDYQKTCVQWLCELYLQKTGGIIGDEMGLGKTVQMISFLAGLHYSNTLKGPVLVVCPATVLKQWCNEFHRWWPPFRAVILHSIGEGLAKSKGPTVEDTIFDDDLEDEEYSSVKTLGKTKDNIVVKNLIAKLKSEGNVIITTYAGLRIYARYLLPIKWGYVVLDEGHKIRNPDSFVTITCKQLKTPNRIILSGTPIQNNLVELWSLFDFVFPGRLGTLPVFQKQFCIPINLGGYANATNVQVQSGYKCAVILKDLVSPYLLRRVKADVAKDLPKKTEMVLFCKLTPEQRTLYKQFIESEDLKKILAGKRNALYGIDMLRKICNHPNLVDLGLKNKKSTKTANIVELASKSGKIQVVMALLDLWNKEKRKTLIFTQTKQMLDILQQLLDGMNSKEHNKYPYMRMDGGTPIVQRQTLVDQFNTDPNYTVFLLTTRVGGLGVNLTGASRVIIYDPDWNPSTDMQARERAWRLGQKQDVAVYRLIMAAAIEEKIYHRQIFKQFLTNKILKDPKQKRFFKMTDMYDLFTLGDEDVKGTETADLFGADEATFDGIKERKTKFKSRVAGNNSSGKESSSIMETEEDNDFIQATKKAGVAGLEEYNDEKVKEKSMFDDDDSRTTNGNQPGSDSNIMSEIFKNSGIHSAVEHESIMNKSNANNASNASLILIDKEATRIANEAVNALKESRKLAKKTSISVPTWTGRFGAAGKVGFNNNKRPRIESTNTKSPLGFVKSENSSSSSSILANLKKKKEPLKKAASTKSANVAEQLNEYMSGVDGYFSKSADILENLDIDFSDKQAVDIVRNILKRLCTWDKERKGWVLNSEFR